MRDFAEVLAEISSPELATKALRLAMMLTQFRTIDLCQLVVRNG
jgi:hypothetical protein